MGTILGSFAGPVGIVLLGILVVAAAGYGAMNWDTLSKGAAPASGDPPKAADKPTAPANGGTPATGTPAAPTPAAPGKNPPTTNPPTTNPPAANTPGTTPPAANTPKTPAPATPAAPDPNTAVLADRAHIDRSGGAKGSTVVIYYADGLKSPAALQPVEIRIAQTPSVIARVAALVVDAPANLKLFSGVPARTKVQSVNYKAGVATVDLSVEAKQVKSEAEARNLMASFVYSLTELKEVTSVQLWINGHPAVFPGVEWKQPMTRNDVAARNLFKVEPVIKFEAKR